MPEDFFKFLLIGGGALSLLAAVNVKEKVGELLSKSITEKPQLVSNENKMNDVEPCPFEIKVTYSNNNTLGKIEVISANNITPFHVQIFNQKDKLVLNGHGKEFLVSSNFDDNVDTEIYAVVKDRNQKEVKTTYSHLYLKKRLDLILETKVLFEQFESMLVKKLTFKVLIAGGMKEGKSATFKSIKKLLEKSGYFTIGNATIHSNSSKKSVTRSVYSYKFQKTINNTPVEIEVIDTPGLWDTPHMDSTEPISFNSRTMLERVMRGSVKNGATEEQILNDTPLPHLVDKIPTPDVLITCFNHSQMLNGFSHKRFEKLKEISEDIGNCPIVLALTWFDEKIDQESSDCQRYMFNGTEFKKLESEEDLYYSNFNEAIKKLLPLDVEYLPIINTDSESVKHLELASRRQLSEYFLVQLLNYAILKVDATN